MPGAADSGGAPEEMDGVPTEIGGEPEEMDGEPATIGGEPAGRVLGG